MSHLILNRRRILAAAPVALLGACANEPRPRAGADPTSAGPTPAAPSARVEMSQTQASLIGSVAWGSGTLTYQERRHPFRIRGLGIGGLGVSHVTAVGDVYDMHRLADFAGLYGQLRAGLVAGETEVQGGVWLRNPAGVRMNLRPHREGVALQVGADGMLIEL